ncbi:glycosyltransferase [Aeromonas veronii]
MNKLLVFRTHLLPYSETFVLAQVCHLKRWHAAILGEVRLDNGLSLQGLEVDTLLKNEEHYKNLSMNRAVNEFVRSSLLSKANSFKNAGYKLIHAHFAVDALRVYPLAKEMDVPLVVTLHGYDINRNHDWWQNGLGGRSMITYPEELVKMSTDPKVRFIAVSKAIHQRAIEFGISPSKVTHIPIGVDVSYAEKFNLKFKQHNKEVIFVGRLTENKGCIFLLRAMRILQKRIDGVHLRIIGDGPLRNGLEEFAKIYNLNVSFLGVLPSANVMREISESKVLCLPSITIGNGESEAFGLVLLEAQSLGVPVITSSRGGKGEGLIHGETGYTFDERDDKSLAEYLYRLLMDDELAHVMGKKGYAFVKNNFDIVRQTEILESFYDDVVSEFNRG